MNETILMIFGIVIKTIVIIMAFLLIWAVTKYCTIHSPACIKEITEIYDGKTRNN